MGRNVEVFTWENSSYPPVIDMSRRMIISSNNLCSDNKLI